MASDTGAQGRRTGQGPPKAGGETVSRNGRWGTASTPVATPQHRVSLARTIGCRLFRFAPPLQLGAVLGSPGQDGYQNGARWKDGWGRLRTAAGWHGRVRSGRQRRSVDTRQRDGPAAPNLLREQTRLLWARSRETFADARGTPFPRTKLPPSGCPITATRALFGPPPSRNWGTWDGPRGGRDGSWAHGTDRTRYARVRSAPGPETLHHHTTHRDPALSRTPPHSPGCTAYLMSLSSPERPSRAASYCGLAP